MKTALLLLAMLACRGAAAQHFDQMTRPVASVADRATVELILGELLIPPPDSLDRIEVVDLTANGYGPDDTVILYPSLETYLVGADVPRRLQDVMKTWEIESDYRLDATLEEGARVAADAHRRQDARAALSADVLAAVGRYYDGAAIEMRLARSDDGLRLDMWNFDPAAMRYRAPSEGAACIDAQQRFAFAQPAYVLRFREPSGCLVARRRGDAVSSSPC